MKRKLNLNTIKDRLNGTISSSEALRDVEPELLASATKAFEEFRVTAKNATSIVDKFNKVSNAKMNKGLYNLKLIKHRWFHGENIFKKIKNIPAYFSQKRYLHKHGYDISAGWETYDWFIHTMRDILIEYRKNHHGYKFPIDDETASTEEQRKAWDNIIDRMIELLDLMDENNPVYDRYSIDDVEERIKREEADDEKRDRAKDEFFQLFSKWFYYLWD